jgi:hypothetical protein
MSQIGTLSGVIQILYLFVACTSKRSFVCSHRGRLQAAQCFVDCAVSLFGVIVFAASAATAKFLPLDKKWDALPEPRDLIFQ